MSKKIGITCTTVFHYVHFHRVAEALTSQGYEVEYIIYTPYHTNKRVSRLVEIFQEENVTYCGFEELFLNPQEFDLLLAPYYMPGFQLVDKQIKKVRLLYGYAKDRWNYAEWNKGFDLVLTYGDYAAKRLEKYTEVHNIGHPRQKNKYRETLIDLKGQKINKGTFKDNKVLIYCPTWADLSSLHLFTENVVELSKQYKVIVKLHHGNVLSGNTSLWSSFLNIENVYLFDEYTDLFDLLQFANIVLSDYSGAIFDAMLFKVPIVLLDVIDESVKDTGAVNLEKMQDISLYDFHKEVSVSLDIKIREKLPHVRNSGDLLQTINKSFGDKSIPYTSLLEELYAYQDDRAPLRATEAIVDLIESDKKRFDVEESFHLLDEGMIEQFLKAHKGGSFHIWGAGLTGQILLVYLKNMGVEIESVMDIDEMKTGKEIFGVAICKPQSTKNLFIAVPGNPLQQIRIQLLEDGFVEGEDFISIFR